MAVTARALVSVVDDDQSVRESLPDLLRELGYAVRVFASAEEFLASDCIAATRCLVLDIQLPGMSGPELHGALSGSRIPVVFITAYADDGVRSHLFAAGAIDCLSKPFSDAALSAALDAALART